MKIRKELQKHLHIINELLFVWKIKVVFASQPRQVDSRLYGFGSDFLVLCLDGRFFLDLIRFMHNTLLRKLDTTNRGSGWANAQGLLTHFKPVQIAAKYEQRTGGCPATEFSFL